MKAFKVQIRNLIMIVSCLAIAGFTIPPTVVKITWKDLEDVRFRKRYSQVQRMYVLYPEFGNKVQLLEYKQVEIKGYMIPVDAANNVYVLSANPMASCFFCGSSGPESIIQLKLKKKKKFATDEIWIVRGIFRLNASNPEELNYILTDTEPIQKIN